MNVFQQIVMQKKKKKCTMDKPEKYELVEAEL